MEVSKKCATLDCTKPAVLQCPTCVKMNLEPTFFCSQDCFKTFWPVHKLAHKKRVDGPIDDGFRYTGTLRPWNQGPVRTVPAHI